MREREREKPANGSRMVDGRTRLMMKTKEGESFMGGKKQIVEIVAF